MSTGPMGTRPDQRFDTRFFDVVKFSQAKLIGPSFFPNAIEYKTVVEHAAHAMLHMIVVRCATKKIDKHSVSAPLNWWEAVKERFCPHWILKRFPVVYRTYTMEASAYYPDIAIPEHQAFVHIEVSKREDTHP